MKRTRKAQAQRTSTRKRKLCKGPTSSSIDLSPLAKLGQKSFSPIVRKAVISDMEILNELAVMSEAHWGFDENHMKAFKRNCAIKENHFEKGYVFVIEKDGEILGFYCLARRETGFELEHYYIDPQHIGKGLGKTLWQHMRTFCIHREIREVTIVCSDFVKDFYLKMGAAYLGQVGSTVDRGTMITRLIYRIDPVNK